MSLADDVMVELKAAMRAREKVRIGALRSIKASIIEALKSDGSESLSEDQEQKILRRLAKQRREAIDAFSDAGRDDAAEQERAELEVIEGFLPKMADEAQTRAWVDEAISATGAASPSDMGKVMGALMKDHRAVLDAGLANTIVRERLNS